MTARRKRIAMRLKVSQTVKYLQIFYSRRCNDNLESSYVSRGKEKAKKLSKGKSSVKGKRRMSQKALQNGYLKLETIFPEYWMKAKVLIRLPGSIQSFWTLRRFFGRLKKNLSRKFGPRPLRSAEKG